MLFTFGYRRRWLPQVLIMLVIWSYVVLVGMSPSVVRSAVMLTIISMVTILNRGSVLLNSLAFAAFLMLLYNPLNLYDIGFEMSFMAVLGISLFEPLMRPKQMPKNLLWKALYYICGIVSVSIAAQAATAPLIAYYFGRFSCYFIITNLIVVPCATAVLIGVVVLTALSWWNLLASHIAEVLISIIGFMNSSLHMIASLPGASIDGISLSPLRVLAIYIFILAIYLTIDFFSTNRNHHV